MKHELPNYPNFYSSFLSPTINEIKQLLEQNGWKIRKQGFDEFECSNDSTELNLITYQNYTLLNGTVADGDTNFNILIDLFKTINGKFQAEYYDDKGNIKLEDKNY